MKTCVKCRTERPLTSFDRWAKGKDGYKTRCKTCRAIDRAEWTQRNPDYFKEHYKKNSARIKARVAARVKTLDIDEVRSYHYAYYRKDPSIALERTVQWRKENPGRYREHGMRRRAARQSALVTWSDEFLIDEIYDLACLRSLLTGIKWQVDHIVPLVSKVVCGLHVEQNLAVITASENASKKNRFWPDMPE